MSYSIMTSLRKAKSVPLFISVLYWSAPSHPVLIQRDKSYHPFQDLLPDLHPPPTFQTCWTPNQVINSATQPEPSLTQKLFSPSPSLSVISQKCVSDLLAAFWWWRRGKYLCWYLKMEVCQSPCPPAGTLPLVPKVSHYHILWHLQTKPKFIRANKEVTRVLLCIPLHLQIQWCTHLYKQTCCSSSIKKQQIGVLHAILLITAAWILNQNWTSGGLNVQQSSEIHASNQSCQNSSQQRLWECLEWQTHRINLQNLRW